MEGGGKGERGKKGGGDRKVESRNNEPVLTA